MFHAHTTYKNLGRFRMAVFLWGNGCNAKMIGDFMEPYLSDATAHNSVAYTLKQLQEKKNNHKWYYFDIMDQDEYFLNGQYVHAKPRGNAVCTREINESDKEVNRRLGYA